MNTQNVECDIRAPEKISAYPKTRLQLLIKKNNIYLKKINIYWLNHRTLVTKPLHSRDKRVDFVQWSGILTDMIWPVAWDLRDSVAAPFRPVTDSLLLSR